MTHRVRFAGRLTHDEVATWLGACDVLSLPSHNEGIPNVILEALACGVPVVASCVGGVAEVIDNDELGLLVEPGDPVALAEALASALDRSWDRDRLAAGAARFTWEAFGTRVADIVGTVLTGKGH